MAWADFCSEFEQLCKQHGHDHRQAIEDLSADILFRQAEMSRAWVLTQSGRRIDLINPNPMDWTISDLAQGQADTARWGGASISDDRITDAQHGLLTLEIARADSKTGLDPRLELAVLIHDASEGALGGFDPISPLKPFLGAGYRRLDARIQESIHVFFGLPAKLPLEWKRIIKSADKKAASSEAHHMTGWSAGEIRRSLKIGLAPLVKDPLAIKYGTKPWRPWSRSLAKTLFEGELELILTRLEMGAGRCSQMQP